MLLPNLLFILTIFCLIQHGIMAWEYNEEQQREIAEMKGVEVKDIDWSKPWLGSDEVLKDRCDTLGISVDEMVQTFNDLKTSMSQEDWNKSWEIGRLSREIMQRFEDKPEVIEVVMLDNFTSPLYKEAQKKWPKLALPELKLMILRENGAGGLALEFDRILIHGNPDYEKYMREEL